MFNFEVRDMTCARCISSITKAIGAIDPRALVSADVATHRVKVERCESGSAELMDAIRGAGYTPVQVADLALPPQAVAPRSGCCCR